MTRGTQGRPGTDSRRFAVHRHRSDAVERVEVEGEVDLSVVGVLDREMRRAEGTDAERIELDLDRLDFLDASGVRLLLRACQRSRNNGHRLRIRPASSPQVRRVLELTGVVEQLPIEASS